MARRLEQEPPYTPLDDSLVISVLRPSSPDVTQPLPLLEKTSSSPWRLPGPAIAAETQLQMRPPLPPVGRATAQPETAPAQAERMTATLRLKVSSREKREFEAFVARLGGSLDATLKPSNILRVMLAIAQHAETSLSGIARRQAPLRRPPNDDAIAYAEFEHQLVRLLDSAIRNSTPLK